MAYTENVLNEKDWGTHVYLWWIHFDIWQNQYNIVKLKKNKKEKPADLIGSLRTKGLFGHNWFVVISKCKMSV